MTNKEIEKTLILCSHPVLECNICDYFGKGCIERLCKDALDYINRLKAENESKENCTIEQHTEIHRLRNEIVLLKKNADEAFQQGLNEMKELVAPEIRKDTAKEILLPLRKDISQCYGDYALEIVDGYIESYGVEVDDDK